MSGARLTRPFRLMKRSGVTECPVMRDVCMVNRPVAAFRTGKMQKTKKQLGPPFHTEKELLVN